MTANPQQALPWIQTLAGLFGGLVNARQQAVNNPRAGFSALPILAGGANGLLAGFQGIASRAEQLRQEQRGTNDAWAQMALQSGLSVDDLKARAGGLSPEKYQASVGSDVRTGAGNVAAARQLNVADPNSTYAIDGSLANTLFGKAQEQLGNAATSQALPQAQSAGMADAGGAGLPFAMPPSVGRLIGPQHRALQNALSTPEDGKPFRIPGLTFTGMPQGGVGAPIGPNTPPANSPSVNVYNAAGTPALAAGASQTAAANPVYQNNGVDLGFPKSLAQIAALGVDPKALTSQYGASAGAANDVNTQLTSRVNNAQTIKGQNERAILNYETPTTASIIANGTDTQRANLQAYAEAGVRRAQAMYGIDKPASRGEINSAITQINGASSREQAMAAAQTAVDNRTMTPQQAERIFNASDEGQAAPARPGELTGQTTGGGGSPASAPRAQGYIVPGLDGLMPIAQYRGNLVPSASMSEVRKRTRVNRGD